jgi:hypothetical protein
MLASHLLAFCLAFAAQDKRAAVPDAAAQAAAEKAVRETFKAEYAARGAKEKAALAQKLLEHAREKKENDASRFVLFRESRAAAEEAGEPAATFRAIDGMAEVFAVDAPALKVTAAGAVAKKMTAPAAFGTLAKLCVTASEEAVASDAYETALAAARAHAARAKDAVLGVAIKHREKDVADLKSKYEPVRKAYETLKTAPDDAAANLTLGRHLCFSKGRWDDGLPHLAKGSDEGLQQLAKLDDADPKEDAAKLVVADGWWTRAQGEPEAVRPALRARSIRWYEACGPGLDAAAKKRVQERLLAWRIEKSGGWEDVTDPKLWSGMPIKDGFVIDPRPAASATLKLSQFPKGDFDGVTVRLRFGVPRGKLGVMPEYVKFSATVGGDTRASYVVVNQGDGSKWTKYTPSELIGEKDEYTLTVVLQGGHYVVSVDDKEWFKLATETKLLTELTLQVELSEVQVQQIRLRYRK